MTGAKRVRRGCSPWAWLGCGCGLVSMIGIVLVFLSLGILTVLERKDPSWDMRAYTDCQANLVNLRRAIDKYRQDHDGKLPTELAQLEEHYLSTPAWLHCPLASRGLAVEPYRYSPAPAKPTDPLITCPNHGQGPVMLRHNGRLLLPDSGLKQLRDRGARNNKD